MKLIKHSILALALFSGISYQTAYAAPAAQYEQTLSIDTLTWEQIDAGARALMLRVMAYTLEVMADDEENGSMINPGKDEMVHILEKATEVDTSGLTGEYKSYMDATLPIAKKMVAEVKALPEDADLDEEMIAIRAKYQPELEVINRAHPNAAIIFDTQDPDKQEKIHQIMLEGSNCGLIIMQAAMTSDSEVAALRKAAAGLREEATKQK